MGKRRIRLLMLLFDLGNHLAPGLLQVLLFVRVVVLLLLVVVVIVVVVGLVLF